MPFFEYVAADNASNLKRGEMEAIDRETVIEYLRRENLLVVKVAEKSNRFAGKIFKRRISYVDKINFAGNLATMIRSGVNLTKALDVIGQESNNPYFKSILTDLKFGIENGKPLSEGLSHYPDDFNKIFINMIKAGEASGKLEESLERLNLQLKKEVLMDLTKILKEMVKTQGIDLVGIASAKPLDEKAPPGWGPNDFMPGTKSIIVVGNRLLNKLISELPRLRGIYTAQHMLINGRLTNMVWNLAKRLEEEGYDAIPIPSGAYGDFFELRGYLSYKHCAVEAGLGSFGRNNLVITPQFGNKVRFAVVVTNAPLECDKPVDYKLCENTCALSQNPPCITKCPVGAIGRSDNDFLFKVDKDRCSRYQEVVLIPSAREWSSLRCGLCYKNCPAGKK